MMTCEWPLSARWVPMPASTDMATASAAARELMPFGPDDPEGLSATELCWITGAGEPVASHTSFMDSSPGGHVTHGWVTHHSHILNKILNPISKNHHYKVFLSFYLSIYHNIYRSKCIFNSISIPMSLYVDICNSIAMPSLSACLYCI